MIQQRESKLLRSNYDVDATGPANTKAFFNLKHKTKYEHGFVVGNTGKKLMLFLDFLGLVEKFYYPSGKYDIELTLGDAVMENSFLWPLGHVELDLPEAPDKAARRPPLPFDPYSSYGPKAESGTCMIKYLVGLMIGSTKRFSLTMMKLIAMIQRKGMNWLLKFLLLLKSSN